MLLDEGPSEMRHSGDEGKSPERHGSKASLVIPAIIVVGVFLVLIALQGTARAALASLVSWLPVSYAFAAGMVASVNPCGFFMLPSYVSYYLGTEETEYYESSIAKRALQALLLGAVATAGFVVTFGLTGGVISAGGRWLVGFLPYAGLVIGILMFGLGLWLLLTGGAIGIVSASRLTITPRRNLANVFLFGIVYALGSLSCTLPIFLVVVGSSFTGAGVLASLGQFIGFALGMGTILTIITLGAALFRGAVARWLGRAIPHVHRASALFLVAVGMYLIYYWVFLS